MQLDFKIFVATEPIQDEKAVDYLATCSHDVRRERCSLVKQTLSEFSCEMTIICRDKPTTESNLIEPSIHFHSSNSTPSMIMEEEKEVW